MSSTGIRKIYFLRCVAAMSIYETQWNTTSKEANAKTGLEMHTAVATLGRHYCICFYVFKFLFLGFVLRFLSKTKRDAT
jgi:hypothetical protein